MKILIFGATGFIGRNLIRVLSSENYELKLVSRNIKKAEQIFLNKAKIQAWNYTDENKLSELISNNDVVINLAGESISGKLWTKKQKQRILNSRVDIAEKISRALDKAKNKPKQIIQSSAIGYYGNNTEIGCDESSNKGDGFLSDVCERWESALQIQDHAVRKVIIRTGVVLGKDGGMMPKLLFPIKYFMGSVFGKGINMVSWIHVNDLVNAIEYLIRNNSNGIYNLTAPNPVTSMYMNQVISKRLKRPLWFRIPEFILKLIFGEMANELLLANQDVLPKKLLASGFKFNYETIEDSVRDII